MRIIETEITGSKTKRVVFATNKKELELIYAIIKDLNFPRFPETEELQDRLLNIKRGLRNGLVALSPDKRIEKLRKRTMLKADLLNKK